MKKYCLTQCAKDRLSAGKEAVVDFVISATIIVLGIAAIVLVLSLIGLTIHAVALFGFDYYMFQYNELGTGFILVLGIFLTIAVLILAIGWLIKAYSVLFFVAKNITMNIIAPEEAECRLFEECKENK